MPGIWEILSWLLYGAIRYIMLWIPLVTPFVVDISIPSSWWRYCDYGDWLHRDNNSGGPDEHWLNCWFSMAIGEFKRLIVSEARDLVESARSVLMALIGGVQIGLGSLGSWIQMIQDWIGGYVPDWAETVSGGLNWLRVRLPEAIRYGWNSWSDIWEDIRSSVRVWARDRYDEFRDVARRAWDWALGTGQAIGQWRDRVAGWIDAFRADPYGYVTGLLGGAWYWLLSFRDRGREQVLDWLGPDIGSLLTFARDCVSFYYGLWSRGWDVLGEIVDDPRAWLMDRLESALADRW